jgi:hypothetical protein
MLRERLKWRLNGGETEKNTRLLLSSSKYLGFSIGPCFPLCGMSREPPWCFFTLIARVFSRTWLVQDFSNRPQANGVKTLRQKHCDNPSYTTRGLQTSLRGWVVIVGFLTIAILVIYVDTWRLGQRNHTPCKRHLARGEKYVSTPVVHPEVARRLRNHALT